MINSDLYKSIIRKYGSPVMVIDSKKIVSNYEILKESLPDVKFYYAVKSNSSKEVIDILNREQCNFDVASLNEIKMCLDRGVDISRLLYTHPIKIKNEISEICNLGINTFVVDNVNEIDKLPEKSDIMIRVKAFNYSCVSNLSKKFGCCFDEIEVIADAVKDNNMNLIGICFHVGSQSHSNQAFVDMLVSLKEYYDILENKGFSLRYLDIGGGFPSLWESPVDMYEFCRPIRDNLKLFKNYEIIAEPGRYIIDNACTLLYSIIGKNIRDDKLWYYVDEGVYGSFATVIYDKSNFSIKILDFKKGNLESCVLSGPTCDCVDVINDDILLPSNLEVGDILFTEYIGAYSSVCSSNFNGFEKTKIVVI